MSLVSSSWRLRGLTKVTLADVLVVSPGGQGMGVGGGVHERGVLVVEEFLELFTQGAEEGEEGSGEESEDEEAISLGGAEEELRRSRGGAEEEPWRSRGGAEEELRRN